MLETLKTVLTEMDIDPTTLKTVREVAVQRDPTLADEPETAAEKQFPIYTLPTTVEEGLALWERLLSVKARTGYYPVVLGTQEDVQNHWTTLEYADSPPDALEKSQTCHAESWFKERWVKILTYSSSEEKLMGKRVTGFPQEHLSLATYYQYPVPWRTPNPQYVGLLPTAVNWEVPSYLGFGCFNDCPCAHEHSCILRYWDNKYGLEIVVMHPETLVLRIKRPLSTREEAVAVAKEQAAYCEDNVFQGAGSVNALAAQLLDSRYWHFWWD